MDISPSLSEIVEQHTGRLIFKWDHYLPIYERYLGAYRHRPIRLLEIGVFHGGSLQMWKRYFGNDAAIVGVDIDPYCKEFADDGVEIEIGDQSDGYFWTKTVEKHADFDIIIDDGSHIASHQIAAFYNLWPHLRDGGTYLVEDCHTSYWPDYGGGIRTGNSFIDFAKLRVDDIHALWSRDGESLPANRYTLEIGAISFHDSVVVFEKKLRHKPPAQIAAGAPSRPMSDADLASIMRIHVKSRRTP